MKLEEKYEHILMQIEAQAIMVYREYPELKDASVLQAYRACEGYFNRRKKGLKEFHSPLPPLAERVYNSTLAMTLIATGDEEVTLEDGSPIDFPNPINYGVAAQLFKHLSQSVLFWSKRNGARGYLKFVEKYIPSSSEEDED